MTVQGKPEPGPAVLSTLPLAPPFQTPFSVPVAPAIPAMPSGSVPPAPPLNTPLPGVPPVSGVPGSLPTPGVAPAVAGSQLVFSEALLAQLISSVVTQVKAPVAVHGNKI